MDMKERSEWQQPKFTKWQVNKIYWAWKSGKIETGEWLINGLYYLTQAINAFGDYERENRLVGGLMGALAKSDWAKAQSLIDSYTEEIKESAEEKYGKVY